jgi:uncharacterized protein YmfQ (DUF2313 family)
MIGRNDTDYQKLLISLLPKGKIWNKRTDSTSGKVFHGLSGELARVDQRAFDLFNQSLHSQVTELIEEYENDYGLHEQNIELGKTLEERVQSIIAKLLEYGGTYKSYFIDILASLGYTITIEEFKPFWCNVGVCGDAVGGLLNLFWWKVLITIEDGINYNIEKLMYEIQKYKPAHTSVLFDFYGRGFSRGFSAGFNSFPDFDNSWGGNGYGKIGDKGLGFGRGFNSGFANAYDYDGIVLTGGFSQGFSIGFDRYSGGGFRKGFSIGFSRPH